VDHLYAVTLMIAIAAGTVAVLTSTLGLIKPDLQMRPDAPIRKALSSRCLTNGLLALGFVSLVTSAVVHSRWGHGPGTVAPMDLGRLLSEHEAFPAAGALLLLALVLALYRSRLERHRSAT
jgi:hypothetical protein